MIVTEFKPYGMIKAKLKKSDRIGIISCNTCVKMCETGGSKQMKQMAKRLKKDGFKVVDTKLTGASCHQEDVKKTKIKGNTVIVMACDAGVYNAKKIFPKKKTLAALDTVGLGSWDKNGNVSLVKKF